MANALTFSFLEMLLLRGMAESDAWFNDGGKKWIYDFDADRFVGKRNLRRAVDKGIENSTIEIDMSLGMADDGMPIRITSLGEKILKAAEPQAYEAYLKHTR